MKGIEKIMSLSKGFDLTKQFYPLIFVPIILDFLQLGDILQRAHGFNLKITIPSAIPSLTQVLPDKPDNYGGAIIDLPYDYLGGAFVLMFIFFVIAGAFLKGGFLGCIFSAINEQKINRDIFLKSAQKFFGRFLSQFLITFILLVAAFLLFSVLGVFGLPVLIGIMILFFYLIFWDYIIVAEDTTLLEAAKASADLIHFNIKEVFLFVLPIALITAFFGTIANAAVAVSPVFAVIAIVVYAYFGTAVVFAVMSFYLESLKNMA